MLLAPGSKVGAYEIVAPIGAGGMGDVYRARDSRLNRDVALKVLSAHLSDDPAALARFEREAQAVAALSHPNILAIHDFGNTDGVAYTATELLEGETLRARLTEDALTPRKAIEYAIQIVRGLAAAHERGIIHRDLKPENVFITRDGIVKILDFGLAKTAAVAPLASAETQLGADTTPGTVLGTVGYMSPEQVRGLAVDQRTDIFSFGATFYEMLTGRRAFRRDSHVETMNAILKEDPPEFAAVNASLPAVLDRVVRRCLEKQPADRFHSAHDLAIALEAVSGTSNASSSAHASLGASAPTPWRLGLVTTLGVIGLVAIAGFLAGRLTNIPPVSVPEFHRLTFQAGPIQSARFASGDSVVYSAAFEEHGHPQIYTTHTESPDSLRLSFGDADIVSVSSKGELAIVSNRHRVVGFARPGLLARAPLSGGSSRDVLEEVQDADWLPDGSNLVVVHAVNGRYRIEFPIGHVVYETGGWVSHVRVSPDGQRVAFLDHPIFGDDRGSAAVVDAAGHKTTISPTYASAQGLAWAASGKEVWFTGALKGDSRVLEASTLDGRTRTVLRTPSNLTLGDIAADGRVLLTQDNDRVGVMGLAPGETKERDLSVLDWSLPRSLSADGKLLLISEEGDGGGSGYGVYLRPTDGSPSVHLGPGEALALSPDAKWAIAARFDPPPAQLVLMPTGAGESRLLTNDNITHLSALFLPDGKNFLFIGYEPGKPARTWVQALAGGPPRPVTPEGVSPTLATADGLAVGARDADGQAKLFPIAGGPPKPIKFDFAETAIGAAPDGDVFVSRPIPGGGVQISRINLTTGVHAPVRQITPRPGATSSVGTLLVTPDGRGYVYAYAVEASTLFLVSNLK